MTRGSSCQSEAVSIEAILCWIYTPRAAEDVGLQLHCTNQEKAYMVALNLVCMGLVTKIESLTANTECYVRMEPNRQYTSTPRSRMLRQERIQPPNLLATSFAILLSKLK